MASVFSAPTHLGPSPEPVYTDGRYDMEATDAAEEAWCGTLAEYCREFGNGDLAGKRIYLPWADGAAQYMILSHKPTRLIHLPLGDAWHVPDHQTRGLRLADLRRMAS